MFRRLRRLCSLGVRDLTKRPPNNIAFLDLLRTLAIVLVFSGHFAFDFNAPAAIQRFPLVYFGWTGVDLFFVLSGYLIGYQLWKELLRTQTIQVGTFLLRRGFRIWPLYFSFVVLILAETVAFHRDRGGLWADFTFLSNYFHHRVGGGWSLSTEEQFYILLPALLFVFSKWLPARNLVLLPAAGLLALPLIRFWTIHYSGMPLAAARDWMYSPIHTHADGLAVGVLIAWLAVFYPALLQSSKFRTAVSICMFAIAASLYVANKDVFNYTSLGLIFGGLTLWGLGLSRNIPALEWDGFYLVSRLSYGIYLNHFGLLPILARILKSVPVIPAYLLGFLACTAFASVTFTLIEAPFLRLRHTRLDVAKPLPAEEVSPLVRTAGAAG